MPGLKEFSLTDKVKVSAVSYLNTKPLLYGIAQHEIRNQMDLKMEYPSLIAKDLIADQVDVGLVPVAVIPEIPHARIISDYGIAADGKVASVCIFSRQPLDTITTVLLDYQSRTSVRLAQLLLKKYWKQEVEFLPAPEDYIDRIEGHTAGVIIGDRALEALNRFEYVYDLSEYWKKYTGLPFIFAAWVANKDLPEDFIRNFNDANKLGLQHLDTVIAENPYPVYDLQQYYRQNIHFLLDEEKHKGLHRFLSEIAE